ncbi:MAG TPA: glutamate racemase [Gammaproteobacteria bacterium]|nr:glutamate racemase [Gammaproteobacteria bacterium]
MTAQRVFAPIGVFDSGVGGLTVLRALRRHLPAEDLIYLGDTARVPYGTKSAASVARYAVQAASLLVAREVKFLVIACNTASAVGLELLRETYAGVPVEGVIEPGAQASCAATRNGHIAVIGTESTIAGGAYQRAIHALRPDVEVTGRACSLLVALAEEGWVEGEIPEAVVRTYLAPLFADDVHRPDTLVLGCTHFPALAGPIRRVVGTGVAIVDSAETTAAVVRRELAAAGLLRTDRAAGGATQFLVTDAPLRFARVAETFCGQPLAPDDVELVDLPAVALSAAVP